MKFKKAKIRAMLIVMCIIFVTTSLSAFARERDRGLRRNNKNKHRTERRCRWWAEEEDEKSDNQTTLETCPIDYPLDLEGPDQCEDKPLDEGTGEEPTKEDNRDPRGGCPSGQCPSGTGTGWGWGWPTFPSYRLF